MGSWESFWCKIRIFKTRVFSLNPCFTIKGPANLIESINVIQEDILINIEIVENLYKNLELVNIMLEEFSNPTLLE